MGAENKQGLSGLSKAEVRSLRDERKRIGSEPGFGSKKKNIRSREPQRMFESSNVDKSLIVPIEDKKVLFNPLRFSEGQIYPLRVEKGYTRPFDQKQGSRIMIETAKAISSPSLVGKEIAKYLYDNNLQDVDRAVYVFKSRYHIDIERKVFDFLYTEEEMRMRVMRKRLQALKASKYRYEYEIGKRDLNRDAIFKLGEISDNRFDTDARLELKVRYDLKKSALDYLLKQQEKGTESYEFFKWKLGELEKTSPYNWGDYGKKERKENFLRRGEDWWFGECDRSGWKKQRREQMEGLKGEVKRLELQEQERLEQMRESQGLELIEGVEVEGSEGGSVIFVGEEDAFVVLEDKKVEKAVEVNVVEINPAADKVVLYSA